MTTQDSTTTGWKVVTDRLEPPIQGGPPLWSGETPFTLPPVDLDTSDVECSYGLNYCTSLATALRIAGLWPNGRPSRGFLVEPGADAIVRGDKCRASTLTMLREATDEEIATAIHEMSDPFGAHADRMAQEQIAWRHAIARAERNAERVTAGLSEALKARDLASWDLKQYPSAWDAWAARAAWDARAARAARAAWDARAARAARAAWDARDAWAAWAARAAWDARDAWAAWDARDARDALTVMYASLQGWIDTQPELLTTGIRDAYGAGLAVAVPVGPKRLGYAMVEVAS